MATFATASTSKAQLTTTERAIVAPFDRQIYSMGTIQVDPANLWKSAIKIFQQILKCTNVFVINSDLTTPNCEIYTMTPPESKEPVVAKTFFNCADGKFGKEWGNIRILEHPRIVKLHDTFKIFHDDSRNICHLVNADVQVLTSCKLLMAVLVQEKLPVTLRRYLTTKLNYPFVLKGESLNNLFMQIGSALCYMHRTHRMTHNDISSINIGVTSPDDLPPNFALFDFGGSEVQEPNLFEQAEANSRLYFDQDPSKIMNLGALEAKNPFQAEAYYFALLLIMVSIENVPTDVEIISANMKSDFMKITGFKHIKTILQFAKDRNKNATICHVWEKLGFK